MFLSMILKDTGAVDFPYSNVTQKQIDQADPLTTKWRFICSGLMAVFVIPFVYQRDLNNLKHFSMFMLLTIIFTISVCCAEHR